MEKVDIPRTHVREYCHNLSQDGYKCVLYKDHISEQHADNHNHHRWLDGE